MRPTGLRRALGALAGRLAEKPDGRRRTALPDMLGERRLAPPPDPGTPVTDLLHARLEPGDRLAVVALMAGSSAELHAAAPEAARRRLELNHAAAFGPDAVRERLGLRSAMPPDKVHSMARTWLATSGDTFLADLVVAASMPRVTRRPPTRPSWTSAAPPAGCCAPRPPRGPTCAASAATRTPTPSPGRPPVSPERTSSARRPLRSIFPRRASTQPTPCRSGRISPKQPALDRLAEMARVVRPGGALALTHGWDALAVRLRRRMMRRATVRSAAEALIVRGHHFVDVFGPDGDWGVRDPGWGDAYLTADWLTVHIAGSWSVELLWPAAIDGAQDLFVLRRR